LKILDITQVQTCQCNHQCQLQECSHPASFCIMSTTGACNLLHLVQSKTSSLAKWIEIFTNNTTSIESFFSIPYNSTTKSLPLVTNSFQRRNWKKGNPKNYKEENNNNTWWLKGVTTDGCTERTGGSLTFYAFWEPNMFFEYLEKLDK
jgi:hypothetical protein